MFYLSRSEHDYGKGIVCPLLVGTINGVILGNADLINVSIIQHVSGYTGERVTMQLTKLKNGVSIPTIGLGVFRSSDGDETVNAVRWALEAGYRHIDTATAYGNEGSVGRAIKESGVRREDIFITTKLRNDDNTAGRTREAFEESLKLLDTDYVNFSQF